MSAATDPTESTVATRRRLRRRKIKAVLAAGIVLGIGAVATLAAFTDDEYASGTFTAGQFGIEGSIETTLAPTTYTSHATSGSAAALSFTSGGIFNNLLPSTTVYAPFTIRLDATTTTNGALTLPGVTTTGVTTNFTYGIKTVANPTLCNAAGYAAGISVLADTTPLGTAAPTFTSTPLLRPLGVPTPVTLCFAVAAGPGISQGQTATATWHFVGTAT